MFNLVLIDNSVLGKSNLLLPFCRNEIDVNYKASIGVEFQIQVLKINGKEVKSLIFRSRGFLDDGFWWRNPQTNKMPFNNP
ncbi:hypothetical protein Csa_015426 [Cucumis sativus]|uniref:Uncharacterized protein n=1 Tax=Cucumis sativus TaxID=3659 RepID=A0A0A0KVZ8_CUCSA|nr:hypothetical protein Csa_015426 [Cucumis sativus]